MHAYVHAAALAGIEALPVTVEVDVQMQGLPGWNMVGLLETAVKEARERVESAIRNAGFGLPNRKTLINLSPADLKKAGAHYDLPIAVALLTAVGACKPSRSRCHLIAGELSLTGDVLPVSGVLMLAKSALDRNLSGVIVPAENAWEAQLAGDIQVVPVRTLADAVQFLADDIVPPMPPVPPPLDAQRDVGDLADVRGQPFAKRGLTIAAAGGHNVAFRGPPGTGKTMLAERLSTILPPLTEAEAIEVAMIQSWHGLLRGQELPHHRPFRAPHHSASYAGLVGGGVGGAARLGEISLAHRGVLFLDEMAEFRKDVLEVLRQPMESGRVHIVRAGVSIHYPARFLLAAAWNNCPCGFLTHPARACSCTVPQIRRYQTKLSGPLMDRIDLHIEVGPPPHEALLDTGTEERSRDVRERVLMARDRQAQRYRQEGATNAGLTGRNVRHHCRLGTEEHRFLRKAAEAHVLSGRALHRVLKVARTIADLAQADEIAVEHLAEALQFRPTIDAL